MGSEFGSGMGLLWWGTGYRVGKGHGWVKKLGLVLGLGLGLGLTGLGLGLGLGG